MLAWRDCFACILAIGIGVQLPSPFVSLVILRTGASRDGLASVRAMMVAPIFWVRSTVGLTSIAVTPVARLSSTDGGSRAIQRPSSQDEDQNEDEDEDDDEDEGVVSISCP